MNLARNLIVITAFAVAMPASAQDMRTEIDEMLDLFATLDRVSGGEDERTANAYLRDKLAQYGVPFESYDIELYLSQPISAGVES